MKFKNDTERLAFLDDFRKEENGWKLWKGDMDLQRKLYRCNVGPVVYVVEEEKRTFEWPQKHKTWSVFRRYIVEDEMEPLGDQLASKTQQLVKLRDLQREGKL